jgi:metal-dependent amidase/aminoacylase/carboxypeptidase family protein
MGPRYDAMLTDDKLARSFARNARRLGRDPADRAPARMIGSTDMGNVSRLVPAIHPMLAISPPAVVPHSAPFAAAAVGLAADRAVLDGAMAMAMTATEVWIGHSDC